MEVFLNEKSLHGQFTAHTLVAGIIKFLGAINYINETPAAKTILKSLTLFDCQAIEGQHINKILNNNRELKNAFLLNLKNATNWSDTRKHPDSSSYTIDEMNYSSTSVAEIAERKLSNEAHIGLLLNFDESSFRTALTIAVIRNKTDRVNVSCVLDKESLEDWLIAQSIIVPALDYDTTSRITPRDYQTILHDQNFFTKTRFKNQGRRVYKRNNTNELWVVDNLHGTDAHLEVFDETTTLHLGTSPISVININRGNAKPGRRINLS